MGKVSLTPTDGVSQFQQDVLFCLQDTIFLDGPKRDAKYYGSSVAHGLRDPVHGNELGTKRLRLHVNYDSSFRCAFNYHMVTAVVKFTGFLAGFGSNILQESLFIFIYLLRFFRCLVFRTEFERSLGIAAASSHLINQNTSIQKSADC